MFKSFDLVELVRDIPELKANKGDKAVVILVYKEVEANSDLIAIELLKFNSTALEDIIKVNESDIKLVPESFKDRIINFVKTLFNVRL